MAAALFASITGAEEPVLTVSVDPVTRCVHLAYPVPAEAPDEVAVQCSWSPAGQGLWQPASVQPLVSETALELARSEDWQEWTEKGRVTERRAAGLTRTVVWNPYPEAQVNGVVDADFRVVLTHPEGAELSVITGRVQADHRDVVYLEDWSQVFQKDATTTEGEAVPGKWSVRTGLDATAGVTLGNELSGVSEPGVALPQLSYPLDLQGYYAVFAVTHPARGSILLRLTGDERADGIASRHARQEVLWRWARMDRQHLVLKQPHHYKGYTAAQLDYVKLVPLPPELVAQLDAQYGGEVDKLVAGYWEPYSWAFHDNVLDTLQHREPLAAFRDARVTLVDTQIGRFGMKVVYESRKTDHLLYSTIGDAVAGDAKPTTDNVGKMQQFTNTLDATLRYASDLGLGAHANFGASNCYPGSPLQGDFSKAHPDWMRGSALRYEVPEVREYVLKLYREALEIGARGLSLDYCRYPETLDSVETGNTMMRAIRELADEYEIRSGGHIPVLVRFPGTGVRRAELFDYMTWAREGWVDYLCPSNIQGRHQHIDVAPYVQAVKGTSCQVLPCVDGLDWGLPMPGPFLWRVQQIYDAGAPGLYVYQADGRILGPPEQRRCMRLLASSSAVRQWWAEEARLRPQRSKGIYLNAPSAPEKAYHGYERVRVWVEGIPMGPVEMYLDDQLITRAEGPPYILGGEDSSWDKVVPPGEHRLRVRAQDGDGWLEQAFIISGR
jgi:hypothetical protein